MSKPFPTLDEMQEAIDVVEKFFGDYPNLEKARESIESMRRMSISAIDSAKAVESILGILKLIPSEIDENSLEYEDGGGMAGWALSHHETEGWTLWSNEYESYVHDKEEMNE